MYVITILKIKIKRLTRKNKRLFDKFKKKKKKKKKNMTDFENYKHIQNQVTNKIRKSKSAEIENVRKTKRFKYPSL